MAQSYTSDRVIFKKGKQAEYILLCKYSLEISWVGLSKKLNISSRTLRDWSKEKKKMSHDSAVLLSKISNVILPKEIKIMKWKDHLKNISVKGGTNHYIKYGKICDEKVRQGAWRTWWDNTGRYRDMDILKRKEVKIPMRDELLAEFVGIILGDGNISDYAVRITLDSIADKDYIEYVSKLIIKLFDIKPKILKHKKYRAVDVVMYRRNIVDFCISLGLKVGDKIKQGVDIPEWIKQNTEYSKACVRGLVDTDGCVFRHSYIVNGKKYSYIKIAFTSKNLSILDSVKRILINLGFHVRITKDSNDVRIENKIDINKYLNIIGTSNLKFISR